MTIRSGLFSFALVAVLFAASGARAQSGRAIVLGFDGAGARAARQAVVEAIDGTSGWSVVDEGEVSRASARMGAASDSSDVAAEVGAAAIVDGRMTKRGRRSTLRVRVRDASSGSVLADHAFDGRGGRELRSEIRDDFWNELGFALGQGHVPAARAAAPAARPIEQRPSPVATRQEPEEYREEASQPTPSAADGARPLPLYLALGATMFLRDFSYADDLYSALRPYRLPLGWTARVQARWYPGAHFTSDFLANIGIEAQFGMALGIRSREIAMPMDRYYDTTSIDFRGGADVRVPIGPVELAGQLGFGFHTFVLGASNGNQPALPSVEYPYFRPGIRGRFDVGAGFYLEAAFGWRVLVGSGQLAQWFPRNSGTGFDLGAHLGWESDIGLGVRAGFEMVDYFFSMNPVPGDPYVAGGATDLYLAGTLDLVYRPRL